jgi:peptidoglycan/xylan/chitin deacetylase (PgdA/CDA1 family)
LTDAFRRQVDSLRANYEMATWESLVAYLDGIYQPRRDLCYLTFDDGLKDHYKNVLPILVERGISGAFFVVTASLESGWVASAHKNHFLMATLPFDGLYTRFEQKVRNLVPRGVHEPDEATVRRAHPWDEPKVARYKYLVNYGLPVEVRELVLDHLFEETFGDQNRFASDLYMNWDDVASLKSAGMTVGGHSHRHRALATLEPGAQVEDLRTCLEVIQKHCPDKTALPFCYPYGMADSFSDDTVRLVQETGFSAAFTFLHGWNQPGVDRYRLNRIDTNEVAKWV